MPGDFRRNKENNMNLFAGLMRGVCESASAKKRGAAEWLETVRDALETAAWRAEFYQGQERASEAQVLELAELMVACGTGSHFVGNSHRVLTAADADRQIALYGAEVSHA